MVQTLKTKGNAALKEKLKKQAGFTLVELLIVVAIIAILAAVAIPAYTAQMDNAKKAVDEQTLSSATSMAASDYLLNAYTGDISYEVVQQTAGDARNIAVKGTGAGATGDYSSLDGWVAYAFQYPKYTAFTITITDGGVVKASSVTTRTTP